MSGVPSKMVRHTPHKRVPDSGAEAMISDLPAGMTPEQAIRALDARGFFNGQAECGCADGIECDRCFALSILHTVYAYRGTKRETQNRGSDVRSQEESNGKKD